MELRSYQQDAVSSARQSISKGHKRPLLVLPTGSGKSPIIGQIISLAAEKGNVCLFICHRRNLVFQFKEMLEKFFSIMAGVIMAGEDYDPGKQVYVTTVQTYSRRMNFERFFVPADLILVDEAHTSLSASYKKIFDSYLGKLIIGTTATPMRSDQKGMGEVYDDLLDIIGTNELTKMGFLTPVRYFVPSIPDLDKLKIRMGDYEKKSLAAKMDTPKLVGDVVESWLKHAGGRKTIVFAVNVAHSRHIRDEFEKVGIPACHLDARSDDNERDAVFVRMSRGEIKVVCNCALYQEGMDVPDISCVVMARPTKSLGLYRQCAGRGMRLSDDYGDMILIDHGGVVEEHGLLTDDISWSLDGKRKAWKKKERKEKDKNPSICRCCKQVFEGQSKCPDCGTELKSFGKPVSAVSGELAELSGKKVATMAEKRRWYGMALAYVSSKGWKQGAAYHKYKEKFGVRPVKMNSVAPIKPDMEFLAYMKHLQIKYAKSQKKVA